MYHREHFWAPTNLQVPQPTSLAAQSIWRDDRGPKPPIGGYLCLESPDGTKIFFNGVLNGVRILRVHSLRFSSSSFGIIKVVPVGHWPLRGEPIAAIAVNNVDSGCHRSKLQKYASSDLLCLTAQRSRNGPSLSPQLRGFFFSFRPLRCTSFA